MLIRILQLSRWFSVFIFFNWSDSQADSHKDRFVEERSRIFAVSIGGTANSLKSILKMLKALAVLKYSGRKKSASDVAKKAAVDSLSFARCQSTLSLRIAAVFAL